MMLPGHMKKEKKKKKIFSFKPRWNKKENVKRGKQGDLLSPKEGGVLLQGTQDGSLLKFNVYRETFKHKQCGYFHRLKFLKK